MWIGGPHGLAKPDAFLGLQPLHGLFSPLLTELPSISSRPLGTLLWPLLTPALCPFLQTPLTVFLPLAIEQTASLKEHHLGLFFAGQIFYLDTVLEPGLLLHGT